MHIISSRYCKQYYRIFALIIFLLSTEFIKAQEKTHLSSDKIFLLTYPTTWKINKLETSAELALNSPAHNMIKPCMLKVQINSIDEAYKGYSLKELAEVETKMLKATAKEQMNLEILTSEFKSINNKEWWVMHGKMNQGKNIYYTNNYKTMHSGKVYVFTYLSIDKNFEMHAPASLKMIQSIEWLTKDVTTYSTDNASLKQKISKENPVVSNDKITKDSESKSNSSTEKVIKNTTERIPANTIGATGKITFKYAGKLVTYTTVRAADGNVWLQQSLGSKRVAEDLEDTGAMGDLFQWGRWDDSHQFRKPANTRHTEEKETNPGMLSKTGKNPFYYDIISLWWLSGEKGSWTAATPEEVTENNGCDPCKAIGNGWRLPTAQEWENLAKAEEITDLNGAFISNLKFAAEGYRDLKDAVLNERQGGVYWSSTSTENSGARGFGMARPKEIRVYERGWGFSIRCFRGK